MTAVTAAVAGLFSAFEQPSVLALTGPPGAGKTTLVEALSAVLPLEHFKLSLEAKRLGIKADPSDKLGWLTENSASRVLRRRFPALVQAAFAGKLVVFENFPGSAAQSELLGELTEEAQMQPLLLELQVSAVTLQNRVAARLVCSACGRPTLAACACGGWPCRRPEDRLDLFTLRLRRYESRQNDVRAALRAQGWPILPLDGQGAPARLAKRLVAELKAAQRR